MKSPLLLVASCLFAIQPALAIDPGTVQGTLHIGGAAVPVKFAAAHLHDNAEKILDRPKEMRILLADREVPQSALVGLAFLPVSQMAKQGHVRGLLILFDPDNRKQMHVTLLNKPASPGESLVTQTVQVSSRDVITNFKLGNNRVSGEIEEKSSGPGSRDMPKVDYRLQFGAPVFTEPAVTADLKGKAAQDSPQARVLLQKARAMVKGDIEGMRKVSTQKANQQSGTFLAQAGAEAKAFMKAAGAEMEKSVRGLQRVVVRGDRAVAIFSPNEWTTLGREGGEWRSDD